MPALISALTALAGLLLSFLVRRRRVFVRAVAEDGHTVVTLGGLTRSDAAGGFENEFAELTDEFMTKLGGVRPRLLRMGPNRGPGLARRASQMGKRQLLFSQRESEQPWSIPTWPMSAMPR